MKKLWKASRLSDKILVGLLVAAIIGWSATAIHANMTNGNLIGEPIEALQTEESQVSDMMTAAQAREIAVDLVGGGVVSELNLNTNGEETTFDVIVEDDKGVFQVVLAAADGALIHLESRPSRDTELARSSGNLTAEDAIEIARAHLESSGITNATLVYSYSDLDDGIPVWSIEFRYDGRDLAFYVEQATGDLLKYPSSANHNTRNYENNDNDGGNTSSTPVPASGTGVSQAEAEAIALAYMGDGRVTWVEREDDHGAMWEVEVTLPNGSEVDVYVAANGTVVHTSG